MAQFEIGDRVEFTPTRQDEAYPGDLEQYRGQQGTVVSRFTDEEEALFAAFFGPGMETVSVDWDEAFMRTAVDDPETVTDWHDRASFNANLSKIDGESEDN